MIPPRLVQTEDGSITCFDEQTGEHYHNRAGAFAESMLNFVRPSGLLDRIDERRTISALDLPFGLGYNSLVLLQELLMLDAPTCKRVNIIGIEQDAAIVRLVADVLDSPPFNLLRERLGAARPAFLQAISTFAPVEINLGDLNVMMHIRQGDMRRIVPEIAKTGHKFDAIWHDPFSANKMPELWTTDLFKEYMSMLNENARVCTYSVAVTVRAGLLEAGFHVYRSTALGAKSGGTVATKGSLTDLPEGIFALNEEEVSRLAGRSGTPFRDPTLNSDRSEIRQQRESELKKKN